MKRVTDSNTLERGGKGEGFRDPDQLRNETFASRRRIAEKIIRHAKGAIFKEHLFENVGNNDADIWKNQLFQLFQAIGAHLQSEEE